MDPDVLGAIIQALDTDATLQALLKGGTGHVFRARRIKAQECPCVTVGGRDESEPRVGYVASKKRDNLAIITIGVWVDSQRGSKPQSGRDADEIEQRIDAILLDGDAPPGTTRCWYKLPGGDQMLEDDTKIWHNPVRYSCEFTLTDT